MRCEPDSERVCWCMQFKLVGDGDWHKCKKLQKLLFDTTSCTHKSCSFGGVYQPALPKTFYGFSYLYDRVAAIGLLDGKPAQYGSQVVTLSELEKAGAALCALGQPSVAERFRDHPDASKANNFCGDVAYLTTLLASFGFEPSFSMTMTNKIKGVELVWTLGAMLAKSAELAGGAGGGGGSSVYMLGLVAVAAGLFLYCRRRGGGGYRHSALPLQGHDSGARWPLLPPTCTRHSLVSPFLLLFVLYSR